MRLAALTAAISVNVIRRGSDEGVHVSPVRDVGRKSKRWPRQLAVVWAIATSVCAMAIGTGPNAVAEPEPAGPPNPYPELRYFTEIDAEPFRSPDGSLWFVTAQGLNCGIWWRGSFGCTGNIPGAPPDAHQIGWISGDARVHYDWTMTVRFPPARGVLTIPPLSYIRSEGTTCATTVDASTYCERGPWRMFITPTHTWLNG
jgi:hypothetical protein